MIERKKWARWLRGVAREILLKLEEIELVPAEIHIYHTPVICVHTTAEFSLSPPQLEVKFCLPPPHTSLLASSCLGRSLTQLSVCNTVRYFSHPLCAEESTGDLAKGVRYVWTQNKDTFYCTLPHTVLYTGSALWLRPLSEPSFGWQVFDDGNLFPSSVF